MLVLPVLVAVFLGLATVASVLMGKMAISQAAEQGAQELASGGNAALVNQIVSRTLTQEGFSGTATTQMTTNGLQKSVTVSMPFALWNTGGTTTLSASRTLTMLPSTSTSSGTSGNVSTAPPASGGGGGGGYVYHHFPMW